MRIGRFGWVAGMSSLWLLSLAACDDPPKKETAASAKKKAAPPEPEKPKGPPEIQIDNQGPKVGYDRVLIEKKDGADRMKKAFTAVKKHFDGKSVTVKISRKAQLEWVMATFAELEAIGTQSVVVKTDSRKSYPQELGFIFQGKALDAPQCSVVTTILANNDTAVWKLSGGMASKRTKGMAGPDLSMTGETIERRAKACKKSKTLFVSAAENPEWGLVYDLAASTKKLEDVKFDHYVLLKKQPVAGRSVKFK